VKVYELKKGDLITANGEVLEFIEIRGEKAVFYNEKGEEISFPDFYYIEEIGEIKNYSNKKESLTPSLF